MLPVKNFLVLSALVFAITPPVWQGQALAAPPSAQAALWQTQRGILVAIKAGQFAEAIALAEGFEPDHPNHEARVAYVRGMVARAKGSNRTAAKEFRKVLAEQPNTIQARQQLAYALYLDGDYDAARHHFDVLETNTADPGLRDYYASFKSKMDKDQPWSLSGYLTLAPSSNINKGSNHETVKLGNLTGTINKEAQKKTGFGLAAGGYGSYEWDLGVGVSLRTSAALDGQFYANNLADVIRVSGSTKLQYQSEDRKLQIGFGPRYETTYDDGEFSAFRYGPTADFALALPKGMVLSTSLAALVLDNRNNNTRDGMRYSVDAQLVKSISPSVTASVNAGLSIDNVKQRNADHTDWDVGFSLAKEWEGGWITRVSPSLGHHDYAGVLALLPEAREDWVYSVGTQLSNRKFEFKGFTPVLNYTYSKQTSNDTYSDYDSHDVSITLTKAF